MATKLQRLERVRGPGGGSAKANPFNQTIIINNPNININYLPEARPDRNAPLSSRGLDNWHLNNNLKEFSETRQLGFFKSKPHPNRNKSNSPYVIHKVRTQDLRSINKIYAAPRDPLKDPMKDTLSGFRKHETLDRLPQNDTIAMDSTLQKVVTRHDRTIAEKFYQGQAKKTPRVELQRNFDTLPTTLLANHQTNPEALPKSFRRNRFEIDRQEPEEAEEEGRIQHEEPEEENKSEVEKEASREEKRVVPRLVPFQMRRRAFNRTIDSIEKNLLRQTEEYLGRTHGEGVPQSQIELFVNSLNQPELIASDREENAPQVFSDWGDYDFHFEEERKKRPRTPKRKKPYDD